MKYTFAAFRAWLVRRVRGESNCVHCELYERGLIPDLLVRLLALGIDPKEFAKRLTQYGKKIDGRRKAVYWDHDDLRQDDDSPEWVFVWGVDFIATRQEVLAVVRELIDEKSK